MNTVQQIRESINLAAGITLDGMDGVNVYFSVKEMYEKVGMSSWKTQPSGRFQINVDVPGSRRDRIFRTKKADGSFDINGVVEALKQQAQVLKRRDEQDAARRSNVEAAELIRNDPTLKLKNTYLSSYVSSTSSFVAPSSTPGKVSVQIYFGQVDAETAAKILAFAKSLEA